MTQKEKLTSRIRQALDLQSTPCEAQHRLIKEKCSQRRQNVGAKPNIDMNEYSQYIRKLQTIKEAQSEVAETSLLKNHRKSTNLQFKIPKIWWLKDYSVEEISSTPTLQQSSIDIIKDYDLVGDTQYGSEIEDIRTLDKKDQNDQIGGG